MYISLGLVISGYKMSLCKVTGIFCQNQINSCQNTTGECSEKWNQQGCQKKQTRKWQICFKQTFCHIISCKLNRIRLLPDSLALSTTTPSSFCLKLDKVSWVRVQLEKKFVSRTILIDFANFYLVIKLTEFQIWSKIQWLKNSPFFKCEPQVRFNHCRLI